MDGSINRNSKIWSRKTNEQHEPLMKMKKNQWLIWEQGKQLKNKEKVRSTQDNLMETKENQWKTRENRGQRKKTKENERKTSPNRNKKITNRKKRFSKQNKVFWQSNLRDRCHKDSIWEDLPPKVWRSQCDTVKAQVEAVTQLNVHRQAEWQATNVDGQNRKVRKIRCSLGFERWYLCHIRLCFEP